MRMHIIAAFLLASGPVAWAQEVIAPPSAPAPTASAPVDERAAWCDAYATWLIEISPSPAGAAPSDVRQSQRLEVELNSCKLDPQAYERETRAEADYAVEVASG